MATEGVQLIQPTGGGAGGEVARPAVAPDFVHMYNESIRTALEPAKFQWERYKDSAALANQLTELQQKASALDESMRHNRVAEANAGLELALRGREADETARSHRAEEGYKSAYLDFEKGNEAEKNRHNQVMESLETRTADRADQELDLKKRMDDTIIAKDSTDLESAKMKLQEEKDAYDQYNHDLKVIQDFKDKVAKFGPGDHYNISENPELQKLYDDTLSNLQTKAGHEMFQNYTGGQTALGEEITNQRNMRTWSPEAHSAFIKAYNEAPPTMGNQERFRYAYGLGTQAENFYKERTEKWGATGMTAYQQARDQGKSEAEAMAIGREAEQNLSAENKRLRGETPVKLTKDDVDNIIDQRYPKRSDESDTDYANRTAKMRQFGYQHPDTFQSNLGTDTGTKSRLNTFFRGIGILPPPTIAKPEQPTQPAVKQVPNVPATKPTGEEATTTTPTWLPTTMATPTTGGVAETTPLSLGQEYGDTTTPWTWLHSLTQTA